MTYLNKVDEKNGPFQYLEKSHLFKNIVKVHNILKNKYSDKWFTDEQVKKISEKAGLKIATVIAEPGDLIVYDGRLWHSAQKNSSDRSRWMFFFGFARWHLRQTYDFTRNINTLSKIFNLKISRIGSIVEGKSVRITNAIGHDLPIQTGGFRHFSLLL